MNHLLAKTKGRKGNFYTVLSDKVFFNYPDDLINSIQYNVDYKLEDDEWFSISDFSGKDYCFKFLTMPFISTEYDQINFNDYSKIDFLVAHQSGAYFFQKLSSSQVIERKFFTISQNPEFIDNKKIIVLDYFPDAIYVKETDVLYFKRLTAITTIFKGIDELYKEATQEETKDFLNNDFIQLENEYSAEKVKKANRKRIAMAMDTLQTFTSRQKQTIFKYIKEYCADLAFDKDNQTFSISSEEDLKKLLYGIEQRYYTTKLGNEKRLANSVITLE